MTAKARKTDWQSKKTWRNNLQIDVDVLVVGGGFKAVVAAWGYARQGLSVALTEAAPKIGGFMSPIRWDEYWIDKGPQFFDNFEPTDVALMEEMLGQGVMEDIGFQYASYFGGQLNGDFAIPDWQALGEDFAKDALIKLVDLRLQANQHAEEANTFDDVLAWDGGPALHELLQRFSEKFLGRDSRELSPNARKLVTFLGRKKLLDQNLSLDLKKSQFMDDILAARKAFVGEERANLYPRNSSLETVRVAMERALETVGVQVFTNTELTKFDHERRSASNNTLEINFGTIFFGIDIREAERVLAGDNKIAERTHILPEIFHCFVVRKQEVSDAYYVVNYEPNHKSSRITHFCNYMKGGADPDLGVVCVEEPVELDGDRWSNPEAGLDAIFSEARETGAITAESYYKAKSFRVPATYKVPLKGIEEAVEGFRATMAERYGTHLVIPDAFGLTRKAAINELRALSILT